VERRYAIIIGINDYEKLPLNFCVNDAEEIQKELFDKCRFKQEDVYLITSDSTNSIKDITGRYHSALRSIREKINPNEDSILFYFAGHGNNAYNKSNLYFHDSGYPIEEVYQDIAKLSPKFQFYIIDSCNSGGKILTRTPNDEDDDLLNDYISKSSGTMFLYACQFHESASECSSKGHGLLTYHFLNSLNNKDLYDKDNILTPGRIQEYVSKETSKDSKFEQIPVSENRITGYYPFAFINQSEISMNEEVRSDLVVIENRNNEVFYRNRRIELQEFASNLIYPKLEEYINTFEANYELSETSDLSEFVQNINTINGLIYEDANKSHLLALNGIFKKVKDIFSPIANSISMIALMQGSTSPKISEYNYKIDYYDEYISSVFFKVNSMEISSPSFCLGFLVYQVKWGIVISLIGFMLDWDGEKDSIAKELVKYDFPFLLEPNSQKKINELNIDYKEKFAPYITEWNKKRTDEINSFLDSIKK